MFLTSLWANCQAMNVAQYFWTKCTKIFEIKCLNVLNLSICVKLIDQVEVDFGLKLNSFKSKYKWLTYKSIQLATKTLLKNFEEVNDSCQLLR